MNARNNLAESLQSVDVCALDDLKPAGHRPYGQRVRPDLLAERP